jgi:heme-degrading monooxygenase HmoA
MPTLVVDLDVRQGREQELIETYTSRFRPAISRQPGFRSVTLLRPHEGARWVLLIAFGSEEERLRWVSTDLHQEAWPEMEAHFESFRAVTFDTVE